jgi:hypothetical protein
MASGLFKQFAYSPKLEAEGVEVKYSPNADGTIPTFTILRTHGRNQRFMQAWSKHAEPFEKARQKGKMTDEQARQININVFIDGLLVGFANVQDENSIMIIDNTGIAELFNKLPDLFEDLQQRSVAAGTFQEQEITEAIKN